MGNSTSEENKFIIKTIIVFGIILIVTIIAGVFAIKYAVEIISLEHRRIERVDVEEIESRIIDTIADNPISQEKNIKVNKLYSTGKKYYEDGDLESAYRCFLEDAVSDSDNQNDSLYELGNIYYDGDISAQDYDFALKLYIHSANTGNLDAYIKIANMYYWGEGCNYDYKRAYQYVNLVNLDKDIDGEAHWLLGIMYLEGDYISQDYEKAYNYFIEGVNRGNAKCTYDIGNMYENGYYVRTDIDKAFEYYKKAADLGNDTAMSNLGDWYFYGENVEQDYEKAYNYYQMGAERDNGNCCLQLGIMHLEGMHVNAGSKAALKYLLKADELGMQKACVYIGNTYYFHMPWFGDRVEAKNNNNAYKYFKKGMDLYQNAYCVYMLGYMQYHGDYGKADKELAHKYFRAASEMGYYRAQMFIDEHY